MKKNFKWYAIAWALVLGLFNLCVFIIPAYRNVPKYTPSFWIGYSVTMVSFIGQIVCAWISVKDNDRKKSFYNISLLTVSYAALVSTICLSLIFMVITPAPYWISAVVCAIVLVANAVSLIKAKAAVDMVAAIDQKVEKATSFIYEMRVDSESLVARANNEKASELCKKVRDAFKYSDPMSCGKLESIEGEINVGFGRFKAAVVDANSEAAETEATQLLILIKERNDKCKMYK